MESTRQNIARLKDITSEVKTQMNSMSRQAKRAERFKALRKNIKETFETLDLTVYDLERVHPNGEYKVRVSPVIGTPLWTSGFNNSLINLLKARGLYLGAWCVYANNIVLFIRAWKEA